MEVLIPFKQRADSEYVQLFAHQTNLISKCQVSICSLKDSSSIQSFAVQICQAINAFIVAMSRKVSEK